MGGPSSDFRKHTKSPDCMDLGVQAMWGQQSLSVKIQYASQLQTLPAMASLPALITHMLVGAGVR